MPDIILISVDLPAPFSPRSTSTSPVRTCTVTSSMTVTGPKDLLTPSRVSSAGCASVMVGDLGFRVVVAGVSLRWAGRRCSVWGLSPRSCASSSCTAVVAIPSRSWQISGSGGCRRAKGAMSSNPTKGRSTEGVTPASRQTRTAPSVIRESAVSTASTPVSSRARIPARPDSSWKSPCSMTVSTPASAAAAVNSARRSTPVVVWEGPERNPRRCAPPPTRCATASRIAGPVSETTAGTSMPGMVRSTKTSGIPACWTVWRVTWAVEKGATMMPSTRWRRSTSMYSRISSGSSLALHSTTDRPEARASRSTTWASSAKKGLRTSGISRPMVSVRSERRERAWALGM